MKNILSLLIVLFICSCTQKTSYTLKWKTASELRNFGYDVYRSENRKGPFTRITPAPIIGAGTSDVINEYAFTDTGLKQTKVYYYYIESISEDGKRKRFTPIQAVSVEK